MGNRETSVDSVVRDILKMQEKGAKTEGVDLLKPENMRY